MFERAIRHLLGNYIRAEGGEVTSKFDAMTLVDLRPPANPKRSKHPVSPLSHVGHLETVSRIHRPASKGFRKDGAKNQLPDSPSAPQLSNRSHRSGVIVSNAGLNADASDGLSTFQSLSIAR